MFKLLIAVALLVAIQGQIAGGFTERPDLIDSPLTRTMIRLAVNDLNDNQNLLVSPVNVLRVSSQVVNGINYRIIFTARPLTSTGVLTCTTIIYQHFSGTQSVTSANCV